MTGMLSVTPARKDAFLEAFRLNACNRSEAAKVAGVTVQTVNAWYQEDESFAEQMRDAEKAVIDAAVREVYRRAVEGVEQPVFQGGEQVGTIRKYSDVLLMFWLKGKDPATWRDTRENSTGAVEVVQGGTNNMGMLADMLAELKEKMREERKTATLIDDGVPELPE